MHIKRWVVEVTMVMCQGGFLVLLVLLALLVLQVLQVLLVLLVLGPLAFSLWARSFAITNLNQQNLQDQKAPIARGKTHSHGWANIAWPWLVLRGVQKGPLVATPPQFSAAVLVAAWR